MEFFYFLNLFYLVSRLIICLHFIFLMIGSALNLAVKLGMRHDELKTCNTESSVTSMQKSEGLKSFSIRLGSKSWSKNMWNTTLFVHYFPGYQGGGIKAPPPTYVRKSRPTGIGLKESCKKVYFYRGDNYCMGQNACITKRIALSPRPGNSTIKRKSIKHIRYSRS